MAESQSLQSYLKSGLHVASLDGVADALAGAATGKWAIYRARPCSSWGHRNVEETKIRSVAPAKLRTFEGVAAALLRLVPGVEGAFLTGSGDERTIIVAAVEHGVIERRRLVQIEDQLTEEFGFVELSVRAHQGRGLGIFAGLTKIL